MFDCAGLGAASNMSERDRTMNGVLVEWDGETQCGRVIVSASLDADGTTARLDPHFVYNKAVNSKDTLYTKQ